MIVEKHHVIAALALVFALAGGGYAGEPLPVIPESKPSRDEIVTGCDDGRHVYAHAWHKQKVLIFGTVYEDGKHDPPDVVLTWTGKNTIDKLWHRGIQVPDATEWLRATDLCDGTAKP
jgi:hypothetical protein